MLFPPHLYDLAPEGHPVRIVNSILDKVDIQSILDSYRGGGSSDYHPRMLLKVLVYAYLKNIYASRQIEEALKENIQFLGGYIYGQDFVIGTGWEGNIGSVAFREEASYINYMSK